MKKAVALLLTAVMLLALAPTVAFAVDIAAGPENIIESDRIRLYLYSNETFTAKDKIRDTYGIGWIGAGDVFEFKNVDFGDEPFYAVSSAISVEEYILEMQGMSTIGGFEVYKDSVSPDNLVAVCEDTVDTYGWDNYKDNWVDMEGMTGVHTMYVRLTGKTTQNYMYVEFRKNSATQPAERYRYELDVPVLEENTLHCSATATKYLYDANPDSEVTLMVAFYDADGELEGIELQPASLDEIIMTGEKSYESTTLSLDVDVTGKSLGTNVKVFLWEKLFSQKPYCSAVSGTLNDPVVE